MISVKIWLYALSTSILYYYCYYYYYYYYRGFKIGWGRWICQNAGSLKNLKLAKNRPLSKL